MKPNITLSMIVKNEAHCIERCLNSVKSFISYWVISDTGSTDNTEEVVKNCLKDIPGEFVHNDWEDFSTNRNIALNFSRQHGDFSFIIDADDYIIADNNAFDDLQDIVYNVNILHGSITYQRPQLIHNSIITQYKGVLHEYMEMPRGTPTKTLEGCKMIFGASGARSKDPEKYLKDAMVFEKALEKDPNNSRYYFYAGQSYRDANQYEKAIEKYSIRAKMGGWIEEQYMALLEVAKLTALIDRNDTSKVESAFIAAYNLHPYRSESMYHLASYCRNQKMFDKAYFYAKIGSLINIPENGLFVEYDCYNWKLQDELAISAYYIGKVQECKVANYLLLNNKQ